MEPRCIVSRMIKIAVFLFVLLLAAGCSVTRALSEHVA